MTTAIFYSIEHVQHPQHTVGTTHFVQMRHTVVIHDTLGATPVSIIDTHAEIAGSAFSARNYTKNVSL
jgi:hypothetical protein